MAGFDFASVREIHHFFHPHILELTICRGREANENYCRGCMKPIGEGLAYHCQPCNFLLHVTCSQIPQQITDHPACSHVLCLQPQPWNYAPSACRCNACWQPITQRFSFHCSICRLDLHPSCANLPMEFKHPHDHQRHKLFLFFIPPYQNRLFTCNICHGVGGSWHYHCSECNYDSHVNCTQIPSIRESLLNEASEAVSRAYVNNGGGHMGGYMSTRSGPGHMERGFWE
ncbi:hypothetical protein SUGI_0800610 [Cryptomeria japonica]|uniref:protein VACUOLELESS GAMETOPHYTES n=1 Tax=Cryptomeria japonica TaxID=3369 RepID=UPI002414B1FC|nr:protein VACUOLELESS GAMETOPHYTES [Cryptomeria japonica]GLJ39242.1 hypothetical protein SUGI_0800610 [Cryptomeria japonica]